MHTYKSIQTVEVQDKWMVNSVSNGETIQLQREGSLTLCI